jgi:PmbA protein
MTLIDAILEKASKKADAAEVFHASTETTSCEWAADKLKLAEAKEASGVALRVLIGGKIGFFASNKIDDPDMIVDTACELAPLGSEFAGEFRTTYDPADVDVFHQPTAAVGAERLVDAGNAMISKAKRARSEAMFDGKLDRAVVVATIANSTGAHCEFRKTHFSGYLGGSITREGDVLMLWEYDDAVRMLDQPEEWADAAIRKFADAADIVTLPAGEYPCILLPKAMIILGPVQSALNARMVLKDISPFKDKVGQQVFDRRINLVDDGLNPEMTGTQPVDDEGVRGQKTILVENGVLRGFIHELHTAKKMGVEPTGNGKRAGLSSAPRAGYTTLTITPGEKSLDEMISGMDKGVVIDQIMGAHQASPFSGDFSVSISLGFVVEKGKIVGRFKDGMLAGNVFRMLKDQVLEIGKELRFTGLLTPPVLFDRMTIAT